uniref:Tubulin-specific chaperone E n=1 Tax=Ixodes ricinus TaxID=34613 RepID=A0A131XQE3_IXORI
MGEQNEVQIGTRVSCDGHYGVVRYLGPVIDTKGTWIGIEWDDPNRGKHNGCHNGVQYFNTRSETGGSFIRPQKLDETLSVPDAMRSKYFATLPCPDGSKDVLLMEAPRCNRIVEFVGPEKVSMMLSRGETIVEASLSHMPVDRAGDLGEVAQLVPNLRYLDLSHTLLATWEQVAEVTRPMSRLISLNLSKNVLELPKSAVELRDAFKTLRQMVLRDVGYSWDQVLQCAEMWPWVEDLVVSLNGIDLLRTPPDSLFGQLRHLSLQENPIASWDTVCKLGHLPKLEQLTLADCDLTSIAFPETAPGEKTPLFANLVSLNLRNNRLEEWSSLVELDKLARLDDLIVNGNPVTVRERRHVTRSLLLAQLGNLKLLDRTEISKMERREAGLFYVNRVFPLWIQCGGTAEGEGTPTAEFTRLHPRFRALLKVYGAPIESSPNAVQPNIMNQLITVEIVAPQDPDKGSIRKRLPVSMTVEKLKAVVMQLFPRKGSRLRLSFAHSEQGKESIFNKERQSLHFYDIMDGSRIYVRW